MEEKRKSTPSAIFPSYSASGHVDNITSRHFQSPSPSFCHLSHQSRSRSHPVCSSCPLNLPLRLLLPAEQNSLHQPVRSILTRTCIWTRYCNGFCYYNQLFLPTRHSVLAGYDTVNRSARCNRGPILHYKAHFRFPALD